jgi:hypothetical protein
MTEKGRKIAAAYDEKGKGEEVMGEDGRGRDRCEMQLRRFILHVARRNGPLPSTLVRRAHENLTTVSVNDDALTSSVNRSFAFAWTICIAIERIVFSMIGDGRKFPRRATPRDI